MNKAASELGKLRWAGIPEEDRKAEMAERQKQRKKKLTKAKRVEIAKKAAAARWRKSNSN